MMLIRDQPSDDIGNLLTRQPAPGAQARERRYRWRAEARERRRNRALRAALATVLTG